MEALPDAREVARILAHGAYLDIFEDIDCAHWPESARKLIGGACVPERSQYSASASAARRKRRRAHCLTDARTNAVDREIHLIEPGAANREEEPEVGSGSGIGSKIRIEP